MTRKHIFQLLTVLVLLGLSAFVLRLNDVCNKPSSAEKLSSESFAVEPNDSRPAVVDEQVPVQTDRIIAATTDLGIRIEDSEGIPISGAQASVGGSHLASSDENGNLLLGSDDLERTASVQPKGLLLEHRDFVSRLLSPLELHQLRRVQLHRKWRIKLHVVSMNGVSVPGAEALIRNAEDSGSAILRVRSNDDGIVDSGPLEHPSVWIDIRAAGHVPARLLVKWRVKESGSPIEVKLSPLEKLEFLIVEDHGSEIQSALVRARPTRLSTSSSVLLDTESTSDQFGIARLPIAASEASVVPVEISAPGFCSVILDVRPRDCPKNQPILVRLVRTAEVELRFELADHELDSLGFKVDLWGCESAPEGLGVVRTSLASKVTQEIKARWALVSGVAPCGTATIYAMLGGTAVRRIDVEGLRPGERRVVELDLPAVASLRLSIVGSDNHSGPIAATLTSMDLESGVSNAPPGRSRSPSRRIHIGVASGPSEFEFCALEGQYHCEIVDRFGVVLAEADVELVGSTALRLICSPAEVLAGTLEVCGQFAMPGLSLTARDSRGRIISQGVTRQAGQFELWSAPCESATLSVRLEWLDMEIVVAERLSIPSTGVQASMVLHDVEVSVRDWQTGDPCASVLRVVMEGGPGSDLRGSAVGILRVPPSGRLAARLPTGAYSLGIQDPSDGKYGMAQVSVPSSPVVEVNLIPFVPRDIELSGVPPDSLVAWSAERSGRIISGEFALGRRSSGRRVALPDGEVEFWSKSVGRSSSKVIRVEPGVALRLAW